MKLYLCEQGNIIVPDENPLAKNYNSPKAKLLQPVTFYILEHPTEGVCIFDAGLNLEHTPGFSFCSAMGFDQTPLAYLHKLGYVAEDVKHVFLSHVHNDHCGYLCKFPAATAHVRKAEMSVAYDPTYFARYAYTEADYAPLDDMKVDWIDETEEYDVFGDGTVICLNTKGHTPGHQSFLISKLEQGPVVIGCDVAHLIEMFSDYETIYPGWNRDEQIKSLGRLQKFVDEGVTLVLGHDKELWDSLKKFPEYYE